MHETDRQTAVGRSIQRAIAPQRAHIVDQPSPQTRTLTDHGRRRSVDRDDDVQLAGDGLDDRSDSLQFLSRRYRARARTRRFTPDIDQRGASRDHRLRVAQGGVALGEAATVGEGIRGDIENPHDMGTG